VKKLFQTLQLLTSSFFCSLLKNRLNVTLKNRDHIIQVGFACGLLHSCYGWNGMNRALNRALKWYEQSLKNMHMLGQYFTFFRFVLNMWFMVSCSLSNQMCLIDWFLAFVLFISHAYVLKFQIQECPWRSSKQQIHLPKSRMHNSFSTTIILTFD